MNNWSQIFQLASAINDDGRLNLSDPSDAAALVGILRHLDTAGSFANEAERQAGLFQWLLILDRWFGWDMQGKDDVAENNTYKIVVQAYLWGWLDAA